MEITAIVLLLHSVSDVPLRRHLENAMGWPIMMGKISIPSHDYVQSRSKFIRSEFQRSDPWDQVEIPIGPSAKSYILSFCDVPVLLWEKNTFTRRWAWESHRTHTMFIWTSKIRRGENQCETLGRYTAYSDFVQMVEDFMEAQKYPKKDISISSYRVNLETFETHRKIKPSSLGYP